MFRPRVRPPSPAEVASAYRDALLGAAPPEDLAPLAAALDPEVVAWIELFHAAHHTPIHADSAFVARVAQMLAEADRKHLCADGLVPLRVSRTEPTNGRHPNLETRSRRPHQSPDSPRRALTHLATAALILLTLIGSLLAFGPSRIVRQSSVPEIIPALETTPTTGPVVKSVPPAQPATNPRRADFRYPQVRMTHYGPDPDPNHTAAPTGFWILEPDAPVAERLPLVLFFHAHGGLVSPDDYRLWLDHLVRRGAVVVYPDWYGLDPAANDANALAGVRGAVAELAAGGHAPVDLDRVAVVGHSGGSRVATIYTARAIAEGLPAPKALLILMPYDDCVGCPAPDLGHVSASTRIDVVLDPSDYSNLDQAVTQVPWDAFTAVPLKHRDLIVLAEDFHGQPPIKAGHSAPLAPDSADAQDWFLWRLFDALMACGFDGTWCDAALGNTTEQRFMGVWSDGVPVQEPLVTDDLAHAMSATDG
jgi:acetyl esterase/lipase